MNEWLERLFLAEGVACRCQVKWRDAQRLFKVELTYKQQGFVFKLPLESLTQRSEADLVEMYIAPCARQMLMPQ